MILCCTNSDYLASDFCSNKHLQFCLILVCIWFLAPNVTVRSHQMEPADLVQLHQKLGQQDAMLESQQQQLLAIMQCLQTMTHQMATLSTAVQAAHSIPAAWTPPASASPDPGSAPPRPASLQEIREPRLPPPEGYDGSPGECRSFLMQCQLVFSLQPQSFPTDAARVAYIITQLTGKASASRHPITSCKRCTGFSIALLRGWTQVEN